jgi:AcrR family transcriptional regulator
MVPSAQLGYLSVPAQENFCAADKKTAAPGPAPAAENTMRDRILGAAFNAFMEKGYAGTSTIEIAKRAKVSKRDLYTNFGNKQAMLVACIAKRAGRMRLPPNLPVPPSREMLASTLTTFGATVLREACHPAVTAMFRLAIAEAGRSPEVAETLDTSRSVNRGALADLLAEAQANRILSHGDPQQMMEQFLALLWGDLMLSRLLGIASTPKPTEIERRAHIATEAFLTLYAN